ncbi:MAG: Ig-like domain-containing protein [Candidatus Peribacteraceae bacterium]|nr:Ig-like domain-containing protein [Candidatus Peribacteraceae bacterium]MDD5742396.1 Ig-like domain-containing protein [Candidatus Peribacteraceae bacterium]
MKKHTALTLCVGFLSLIPLAVFSAASPEGTQTVAGLGAEITCQGFAQNETISVRILPPLGAALPLTGTADAQGTLVLHVSGEDTQMAGSYAVQTDGKGSCTSFLVLPDALDQRESSIETDRDAVAADGVDAARITVILRDRYLNPLGNRPVQLISGRTEDQIRALTAQTGSEGQQTFSFTTLKPGTAALRAIDLLSGKPLDAPVSITVGEEWGRGGTGDPSFASDTRSGGWDNAWNQGVAVPVGEYRGRTLYGQLTNTFDVVDHFRMEIEGGKTSVPIRQDTTFRVVAEDRSGRTVEDYAGTIRFSSTDPKAILPFGTRQFTLKDLGVKTFTLGLRFNTGGEQTLAVEDTPGNVQGSATVTVTGGGTTPDTSRITVTEPIEGTTVNASVVNLRGIAPPLVNLLVTGGKEIARGDSDETGNFQIAVTLNTTVTGATLQIEEASGKYKSNPLHLLIDLVGPRINAVEFSPLQPAEGQTTQITVKGEAGSAPVTMTLEGASYTLNETPSQPGTYTASFTAPVKAATYQPLVTATDRLGNKTEMLSSLTVKPKTPPTIKNLTAEAKMNAVALKWEQVAKDEADTYRVYVGDKADNFTYSLDTDASVSAATVAGLKQATTYYFAITAIKNGTESAEKSNIASATVLGLKLAVIPGDTSLMLRWSSMKKSTPLSAYLLEYGVEADNLTEKRMINGDAESYTLRDLINGVTYSLRLTPITVPGEVLKDLAATAEGTPNGAGFHPVAGSGTQIDIPLPPMPPASAVPPPGMPPATWAFLVAGAAGLVFLLIRRQRRMTLHVTSAFLQDMQRRYQL